MKVWELIEKLSKCRAGADVQCQRGACTHIFDLDYVNDQDDKDFVVIIGDESTPDEGEGIEL